ncbi:MAG TPA: HAMP domain-containing sensor histidine kinase, partial [Labilithrix sp.]|nr:HAMP domain-containing sensor histidine kinase [Labilithrix sp.]
HELRSPLGRARSALEIARERKEGEHVLRALDDVDRQLVEIDAILGDLLASARAGLADVRRESVDIVAWLERRALAETTGPVEVARVGADDVHLEIDPALLGRAFHNVLANAWAHGHPKDAPLLVTLSTTDDLIRIAVRDRGPGFAAEILPRAFDPFVTGTGAARSPGAHGMGLGLALVRRIVEAHGGHATAENVHVDGRPAGAIVTIALERKKVELERKT